MGKVYIVSAKRTAVGSFLGTLSNLKASEFGGEVIQAILEETKIPAAEVDEIVITVIATEFEKEPSISSIGVDNIVSKAWDKKISSIPTSTESTTNSNDLDIPSFLRKNKNK